jgi:hypothetical protein
VGGLPRRCPDNRERRESNFVAYVATGVWHHYLVSGDRRLPRRMWPVVDAAIGFVLKLQSPMAISTGPWTRRGKPKGDALVTGCSSIYKSLECAHNIAVTLGEARPAWLEARARLGEALRRHPERFDRTWESKSRYSMDWFYPVLTGVISGPAARERLAARWASSSSPAWAVAAWSRSPGSPSPSPASWSWRCSLPAITPAPWSFTAGCTSGAARRRLLDRLPVRRGPAVAR